MKSIKYLQYHMCDLSWLSPIMYAIKFRISVKCPYGCIFQKQLTNSDLSMDHFCKVLLIDDVFPSILIVAAS